MNSVLKVVKEYTALLIAAMSAYIYFCVYGYEISYLEAFNIPANFATIDLNTILVDAHRVLIILLIAGIGFYYAWSYANYYQIKEKLKMSRIVKFSFLYLATIVFVNYWGDSSQTTEKYFPYFLIFGEIVLIVFCILVPIQSTKTHHDNADSGSTEVLSVEGKVALSGVLKVIIVLFFLFTFALVDLLGRGQAKHQDEFQIVDSTNYVVVRKYGDLLVCVDYDTLKRIIGSKILLIKDDEKKVVTLNTRNLGRLADFYGQLEEYKRKLQKTKKQSPKDKKNEN